MVGVTDHLIAKREIGNLRSSPAMRTPRTQPGVMGKSSQIITKSSTEYLDHKFNYIHCCRGMTALIHASTSGKLEFCDLLLRYGANVNAKDEK